VNQKIKYKTYYIELKLALFSLLLFLMFPTSDLKSQLNIKNKSYEVKTKASPNAENIIDRRVDETLGEAEEILSGNKEFTKTNGKQSQGSNLSADPNYDSNKDLEIYEDSQKEAFESTASSYENDSLVSAYISKFDFIPGENILGVEDFELEEIGDFPSLWDTDASGEVVSIPGMSGKWLKLGKDGFFLPEFFKELPENFTMEFDVVVNEEYSWFSSPLYVAITTSEASANWRPDKRQRTSSGLVLSIHPVNASSTGGIASIKAYIDGSDVLNSEQEQMALTTAWRLSNKSTKVHISLWKQGQRIRIYLNEKKYWDLPRAFSKDLIHNRLFFLTQGGKETEHFFISNFTLAIGTPDSRNRLITEGSLTTNGIKFDVNSDRLKEESYGLIKEIATVLKENPGLRVKIVGHTDSDGQAESNQVLSLKRAVSVRSALVSRFNIDPSRLEVEGKGASEPVAENNSPLNKALNRRVQFIKL
jgi:OmpA-OmpF porin, OOP family